MKFTIRIYKSVKRPIKRRRYLNNYFVFLDDKINTKQLVDTEYFLNIIFFLQINSLRFFFFFSLIRLN